MPPKPKPAGGKEEDVARMVEGISGAHSWIKANTMLRPTKLGKKRGENSDDDCEEDNDICISLSSKNPNSSFGQVWYVQIVLFLDAV